MAAGMARRAARTDHRAQLDGLPADERGAWADVAGQGAAVLYGWAQLTPRHALALRRCGEELARSAQLPARELQAAPPLPLPRVRGVVMLCAAALRPRNEFLYWLVLGQELAALTRAISDMHQAAGEAQRAAQLAAALREQFVPVCDALEAEQPGPSAGGRDASLHAAPAPRPDVAESTGREAVRPARIAQSGSTPPPAGPRPDAPRHPQPPPAPGRLPRGR